MPLFDGRLLKRLAPLLGPILHVGDLTKMVGAVDLPQAPAALKAIWAVWGNDLPWNTAEGLKSHSVDIKNAGHAIAAATTSTLDDGLLDELDALDAFVQSHAEALLAAIAVVKRLPQAGPSSFSVLSVESAEVQSCGLTAQSVSATGLDLQGLLQFASLLWQLWSTIRSHQQSPVGASVLELAA